jgi:hypothetical protein
MEQRLCIKIVREEHRNTKEIAEKLVRHFGTEALSYLGVCYWMCEFARGREQVEDARRSGRLPDFICHSRIQAALKEWPNASVRQLAKIFHFSPSNVFDIPTFVLHLTFRHWKLIPHFLSEDEKEADVNGKIPGNFVGQSATTKLAKLLDRGWVMDYVE